jgi:diguanylate cyclase (GGDEF)-like protein
VGLIRAQVRAEARTRLGPRRHVWAFIVALATAAATLNVVVAAPVRQVGWAGQIGWWALLAAGFAVADLLVVHVNIGRHAHSFSASDVPLAAALLLLPHASILTSRLLGGALVLVLVRRQSLTKLAFNLAQWSLAVVSAVGVWTVVAVEPNSQLGWLVALGCVLLAETTTALAISAVIALDGGRMPLVQVGRTVGTHLFNGLANVAFVLVSVAVARQDWRGLWAVAVVATFLVVAHRSHLRLQRRHGALERLNDVARRLGRDLQADAIAQEIVTGAAATLSAATARLELVANEPLPAVVIDYDGSTVISHLPDDAVLLQRRHGDGRRRSDCISAPLRAHGKVLGYLSVTGSVAVKTFGADEQHLLDTLAQHASTALTNGRLADELRVQVADNEHQATHDLLTGLPNRLMFERVVGATLRSGRPIAVLLLDLDRFKEVNDTLGHAAGDALLRDAGTRLQAAVPQALCIARLGGDEFTVLLTNADGPTAIAAAEAAREALLNPLEVNSVPVSVDASIGIALAPEHGGTCDDLLRHADVAMYAAKDGRGGVAVYDADLDHNDASRLGLAAELRDAVATGGIFLNYQPKLTLLDGAEIASVEALARWIHPARGFVPPDEFIPVAEQTGSIIPLTDAVLTAALRQCRTWLDGGLDMSIAVNVSPRILRDQTFPDRLASMLAAERVPAARLTLEITESAIMDDVEHAVEVLWRLRKSGVRLSIDDLGIGHSSLAYLKRLPVHEVKIDKSFVLNMADDPDDDAIVCAVVGLAHRLRMRIVAEGVETQRTRDRLVEIGCDIAQGYWYSRPMPAADVAPWFSGYFDTLTRQPRLRVAAEGDGTGSSSALG